VSPRALLTRVVELAATHGPDVFRAVKAIEQALEGEHPELRAEPLPDEGASMNAARAAALERTKGDA